MTAIPARARAAGPVLHSRACAAVTAASCAAHLWLAAGNHHAPWLSMLMLAMAAVCLPCSLHIWRHRRTSAVHKVMASALAMAVLHAVLLLSAGSSGHNHGTAGTVTGSATSAAEASLAVIALEIATALLAATLLARIRRRSVVARR